MLATYTLTTIAQMALVQKRLFSDLNCHPWHLQCNCELSNQGEPTTEASFLPKQFPSCLPSSLAWDGSNLDNNLTNIYHFTEADALELDAALSSFKGGVIFILFQYVQTKLTRS